jgi:dGTP triphosphohydrolase
MKKSFGAIFFATALITTSASALDDISNTSSVVIAEVAESVVEAATELVSIESAVEAATEVVSSDVVSDVAAQAVNEVAAKGSYIADITAALSGAVAQTKVAVSSAAAKTQEVAKTVADKVVVAGQDAVTSINALDTKTKVAVVVVTAAVVGFIAYKYATAKKTVKKHVSA